MASKLTNRGSVPQGMLAPSGFRQTEANPNVQATTRPAGSILRPSPGYDSIRPGKNRFQGKGPSGGFRPFEYAEDVGGSGAALSVVPGDTSSIAETEWLPESEDSMPEGSMVIADRPAAGTPHSAPASHLHEGYGLIPDMGDRSPGRPLSRLLHNPVSVLRQDYRENKVMTVLAGTGLVVLLKILGDDLEREYRARRGRGVAASATAPVATGGDEIDRATNKITETADSAVEKISNAANEAVSAVKDAGQAAADTVKSAANTTE